VQVLDAAFQYVGFGVCPVSYEKSEDNAGNLHHVKQAQRLSPGEIVGEKIIVYWLDEYQAN
jgi:hypothetical protein